MLRRSHFNGIFAGCVFALICASSAPAAITHRYSFNDAAAPGKDSVGNVDAKLKGSAATVADGKVTLKNEDKTSDDPQLSYVEFDKPIIPKTGSVSIAIWFTANETGQFSRLVNFSDKEGTEGRAFIYIVPRDNNDESRAAITATDAAGKTVQTNPRLDDGKPHMVALVIDGAAKKMHVFIDGKEPKPAEDLGDNTLDKVRPVNNWLGRSSFDQDAGFGGSIDELRTYDQALSADEVGEIFKAGADELPKSAAGAAKP
jgi:hypothetical protein